jgi:prepilin-type processing-associated H-X9-DG protein
MPYHATSHKWYSDSSPYLDDTYQATLYTGNNVYHCPFAKSEIRNQWKVADRFSFHFGMNQKVYGDYNTALGWLRPVKHRSAIRSQCVILGDGRLYYFGPSSLAYFDNELADTLSWPIAGRHSSPSTFAGIPARIDLHGGVVNLSHMDGHVSSVVGTWTATEANLWNP